MAPLITLTTDFGEKDPYVAAMKGVLWSALPGAHVTDLSHQISPQDVLEAALFLSAATPYFPPGTIHVAVVDPGVGTSRRALAVRVNDHILICPDNGVLTLVLRAADTWQARHITNPDFVREVISPTFHGRDVFAPAAARLAAGAAFEDAGPAVADLVLLDIPEAAAEGDAVRGEIVHVDHFGNLITNIPEAMVPEREQAHVRVGLVHFPFLGRTYSDVPEGKPLALFGSSGHLEVAVNGGSAAQKLRMRRGVSVRVEMRGRL